jgi:DNA-binding transcriptional regulator YiaG
VDARRVYNCARYTTRASRKPEPTDAVIGHNIRILRLERRMSQTDLADHVGVTFQQVQKYERGAPG